MPYDLLHDKVRPLYTGSTPESILRENQQAWKYARIALSKNRNKALEREANKEVKKPVTVGSLVFHEIQKTGVIRPKLANKFEGPYRAVVVKKNRVQCLDLSTNELHWFHPDTLKLADKFYQLE